eukprot:CAMPEP_0173437468 /NCGR_PEP_ID=MMETSP1357-20121228/18041_1 /TAXON_ID=77926 /ORGANISM="Hemiselmis rufescens, Strain PCC563" /LENGTH=452 /DNA_ID=CAMNT_0014402649 /DNA_START=62 /DNA_END=1417 /DNA_ORIENTATION=-
MTEVLVGGVYPKAGEMQGYQEWSVRNSRGWSHSYSRSMGLRKTQEDEIEIVWSGGVHLFCVFDGHSGGDCSKALKAGFARGLCDKLAGVSFASRAQVEQIIRSEVSAFDRKFLAEMKAKGNKGDGSTLNLIALKGDKLVCANVGDSRAVLVRAGRAVPLSVDHKPEVDEERKRIEAKGGWVTRNNTRNYRVNGVLAISRTIGDLPLKEKGVLSCEPGFVHRDLTPGDQFAVVGTDGLWDCMTADHSARLTNKITGKDAAKVLVSEALSRGSTDNTTCIVVDLRSSFSDDCPPQGPGRSAKAKEWPCPVSKKVVGEAGVEFAGTLSKRKSCGIFDTGTWQQRWFMLKICSQTLDLDASVNPSYNVVHFVIDYADKEGGVGRRPRVLDPTYGAKRERELDQQEERRYTLSVMEGTNREILLLATGSEHSCDEWVSNFNAFFRMGPSPGPAHPSV